MRAGRIIKRIESKSDIIESVSFCDKCGGGTIAGVYSDYPDEFKREFSEVEMNRLFFEDGIMFVYCPVCERYMVKKIIQGLNISKS